LRIGRVLRGLQLSTVSEALINFKGYFYKDYLDEFTGMTRFFFSKKSNRLAFGSCTASSTNPMDVVRDLLREVVVDDAFDIFHIY